jgi:hypothetical protein
MVVCTWAVPSEAGYIAIVVWAATCGVAFGAAATICGSSLRFVGSSAILGTALLPALALLVIAKPVYGNWASSVAELVGASRSLMPMFGLEFFLPTVGAVVAAFVTSKARANEA